MSTSKKPNTVSPARLGVNILLCAVIVAAWACVIAAGLTP